MPDAYAETRQGKRGTHARGEANGVLRLGVTREETINALRFGSECSGQEKPEAILKRVRASDSKKTAGIDTKRGRGEVVSGT
jgi:hypothetical protein